VNTVANPQKNTFSSIIERGAIIAFALVLLILISFPVAGAAPLYQVDWVPGNFFVVCEKGSPCPLHPNDSAKVASLMSDAVRGMKAMPFTAPLDWGKRVGQGTANDYIELYQVGGGIASAAPRCGGGNSSRMLVGKGVTEYWGRDYLLYYFMAHEVFHLIQYGYNLWDRQICDQWVPGWILEGMATAVGLEAMRKRYPSVAPSSRDDQEARQFAGLRRYDKPLPHRQIATGGKNKGQEMFSGDRPQYYTSSFWRHIANAHHRGKYDYLHTYMRRSGQIGDWMPWLRNNIEDDVGADLGIVFSGFLADYAGWGDPGFPGLFFGRNKWLREAFDGCERVYLDKNNASAYIELEILPLSGKCIEVRVSAMGDAGLQEGESAAVQITAIVMEGSPSSRDGLHLSMAASNGKKKFHCAREVKSRKRFAVGKCIFTPDDGKIRLNGGQVDARVWNVIAQEKGDPSTQRQQQGEGKGELVNLYTASYTPVNVSSSDTMYGGKNPVYARFYFVLDVAKLEFDGKKPASSGAAKKRVVGSLLEGDDPQTTLPKQDANGNMANSYSLPEQFRPNFPIKPMAGIPVNGKLSNIIVGQQLWEGDNSASDVSSMILMPAKQVGNNEYEPYALSVGETGSFPALITASVAEEPLVATSIGSLMVDEFTDLVLRASFNGTVCRLKGWNPKKPCPKPIQVSGKIVKAFAGTRLPGNHMIIERTPGTEMYRKAAVRALSGWSGSTSVSSSPGSGTTVAGTSSSAGGVIGGCACTCKEREDILLLGEAIKLRTEAGEDVAVGEIMSLTRCSSTCRREYMICVMEEDQREKAAEEALRIKQAAAASGQCDCGCDAFAELKLRSDQLMANFKPGDTGPQDEIASLTTCFQSCMSEFMSCAQ
jgi:hypothetical protein